MGGWRGGPIGACSGSKGDVVIGSATVGSGRRLDGRDTAVTAAAIITVGLEH